MVMKRLRRNVEESLKPWKNKKIPNKFQTVVSTVEMLLRVITLIINRILMEWRRWCTDLLICILCIWWILTTLILIMLTILITLDIFLLPLLTWWLMDHQCPICKDITILIICNTLCLLLPICNILTIDKWVTTTLPLLLTINKWEVVKVARDIWWCLLPLLITYNKWECVILACTPILCIWTTTIIVATIKTIIWWANIPTVAKILISKLLKSIKRPIRVRDPYLNPSLL